MKPGLKAEAHPANDHRESVELSKRFPECGRCCAAALLSSPRDAAMIVMAITAIGPVFAPLRCGAEPSECNQIHGDLGTMASMD